MKTQVSLASTPIMSQANSLGQGFNIYGELGLDSMIRPLVNFNTAGTKVFTFLGQDYLVPSIINPIESTKTYYDGGTFQSREGFQNKIAAHAGVQASYGAFSGEMKADFSAEFAQNTQYIYLFNNLYTQLAYLQLEEGDSSLTSDFQARLAQLPSVVTPDNTDLFANFFEDFGIYYTLRVILGASLEFYVSVRKTDATSSIDLAAMMEAQYKGLTSSGKLDASVKASQAWQSYSQSSRTQIRAIGGDPVKAAALAGIDPLNPSDDSVRIYNDWTGSIQNNPAIVDFQLMGIWELAGEKRDVIEEAWQLFGAQIHPRLTVETRSEVIYLPNLPAPVLPIITLNGNQIKTQDTPDGPCGFQVIIADGSDLTGPTAILLNRAYSINDPVWASTYQNMYNEMLRDIQASGVANPGNLLILVSFGLDMDMPPPDQFYAFLRSSGAGQLLKKWEDSSTPGSMGGNLNEWTSWPVNYILVAFLGEGPDTGLEVYNDANTQETLSAEAEVYFYRETFAGRFTLGGGD